MHIKELHIEKFRGFKNVEFELGSQVTIIAGQNGTQKTTLLGILSQCFSITSAENPLKGEAPLCGGSYKSAFSEKFKLSDQFDKPGEHEWTLRFIDETKEDYTVESIARDAKSKDLRFWKKKDRSKGSGYIQLPVIYLSLTRLFPIGEDKTLKNDRSVDLTEEEQELYKDLHDRILCIHDSDIKSIDYLSSKQKNTLGATTDYYDWQMNSAGQDNVGKIILALLSFRRLKEKHEARYKGGILVIDEIDATLFPASQLKLLEALIHHAQRLKVQVFFTTHSLVILKKASEMIEARNRSGLKIVYLEKVNSDIIPKQLSYEEMQLKLNILVGEKKEPEKIPVITEDKEAIIFLKKLLNKEQKSKIVFWDGTLGCRQIISLAKKKIPYFRFPDSLIILDADVELNAAKKAENIVLLPDNLSPERILATFIYNADATDPFFENIGPNYSAQLAFLSYKYHEIMNDRKKAKKWFNEQRKYWGRGCARIITPWKKANPKLVKDFSEAFDVLIEKYKKYYNQTLI